MLLFSEKTQSKKPILPARLTRILLLATFAHPNQYGHESECWAEGHHRCVQHPDSPTDILLVESEGKARDGLKRASGVPTRTRRLVLVRGRKQWATFIHQPWRVALSAQIQTTIIPGEKMVVIHPGRHPWLESGAESHLFHPMHKPGIFRYTLSYSTMEIRSFTYRFLRRNIDGSQLFTYQCHKRNVGQLL